MTGNELPPWAVRLRQERTRRLWSQKITAIRLRDAADRQTRATLPDVESIQRYVRAYEAGRHFPGDLYAELYCRAFGLTREGLFGASSARQTEGSPDGAAIAKDWLVLASQRKKLVACARPALMVTLAPRTCPLLLIAMTSAFGWMTWALVAWLHKKASEAVR